MILHRIQSVGRPTKIHKHPQGRAVDRREVRQLELANMLPFPLSKYL